MNRFDPTSSRSCRHRSPATLLTAALLATLVAGAAGAATKPNPHIYHHPKPATDQDRVTIVVEGEEPTNCIPNLYKAYFSAPFVIDLLLAYPGGDPGPFCSPVVTPWREAVKTEKPLSPGRYLVRVFFTRNGNTLSRHDYWFDVFATGEPTRRLGFDRSSYSVSESANTALVTVERTGSGDGTVSARYTTVDGTARAGSDYEYSEGTLTWHHGDMQPKQVAIPLYDDFSAEGNEHFEVRLDHFGGGAEPGSISVARVEIEDDDDARATSCHADAHTLCLNDGRFEVTTRWRTPDGQSGRGRAKTLTGDSGYFWFFKETNVEVLVKMLDGCGVSGSYWMFASGMTDIWVEVTVVDTVTGERGSWVSPQGIDFALLKDVERFRGCS